jgi:hypothetical protein
MIAAALTQARQKLELHWEREVLSRFTRDDSQSYLPLTLMVPLAPKDINRARISIPRMLAQLAHPVTRTLIVAPDDSGLRALAAELGAEFLDEMIPLSAHLGAESATALSGWHKQQFLKLLAPETAGADNVEAIDSDTYPIRPTAFTDKDGRLILLRGDRNLAPFHRFTETLIGPCPGGAVSFVAHVMLFRAGDLAALRRAIEAHCGKPWIDAVLDALARPQGEVGSMSEFDLLAHFLLRDAPDTVRVRYYANIKASGAAFADLSRLPRWKRRFRFISNHHHSG